MATAFQENAFQNDAFQIDVAETCGFQDDTFQNDAFQVCATAIIEPDLRLLTFLGVGF